MYAIQAVVTSLCAHAISAPDIDFRFSGYATSDLGFVFLYFSGYAIAALDIDILPSILYLQLI